MPTKKAATGTKTTGAKGVAKKANPKTPAKAPAKAKMSALDAAARVLSQAGEAMSTAELIEAMAAKKLWQSPNGKTPAATLYAAILREITTKGADSRFRKTAPGRFAATGAVEATPTASAPMPAAKGKGARATKKEPTAKTSVDPTPARAATVSDDPRGPVNAPELART